MSASTSSAEWRNSSSDVSTEGDVAGGGAIEGWDGAWEFCAEPAGNAITQHNAASAKGRIQRAVFRMDTTNAGIFSIRTVIFRPRDAIATLCFRCSYAGKRPSYCALMCAYCVGLWCGRLRRKRGGLGALPPIRLPQVTIAPHVLTRAPWGGVGIVSAIGQAKSVRSNFVTRALEYIRGPHGRQGAPIKIPGGEKARLQIVGAPGDGHKDRCGPGQGHQLSVIVEEILLRVTVDARRKRQRAGGAGIDTNRGRPAKPEVGHQGVRRGAAAQPSHSIGLPNRR